MSMTTETKSAADLLFSHYLRTGERLTGEAAQAFLETKARDAAGAGEQKSTEAVLFAHFLRTGERLYGDAAERFLELKFNQRHYRENGQFARAGEGVGYGGGEGGDSSGGFRNGDGAMGRTRRVPAASNSASQRNVQSTSPNQQVDPVAKRQRDIGMLAAKYESRKLEGPGTISSGRNDSGGVSYGSFQMSSNKRVVHGFIASPEASAWSAQFMGKMPVTKPFDDQWRAIAAADPIGFESAQRAYIVRTNYSEGAQMVRRGSGFDLEGASPAVRMAFFATAVQHGPTGGSGLFVESLGLVSGRMDRSDPRYESALINALYNRRTEQRRRFAAAARLRAAKLTNERNLRDAARCLGKAQQADNDANRRYPRERYDALLLLSGQPMSKL
jgi:hypothetical protein